MRVKVCRAGVRVNVMEVAEASREFWRRERRAEGRVVRVREVWRRVRVEGGRRRMVGVDGGGGEGIVVSLVLGRRDG